MWCWPQCFVNNLFVKFFLSMPIHQYFPLSKICTVVCWMSRSMPFLTLAVGDMYFAHLTIFILWLMHKWIRLRHTVVCSSAKKVARNTSVLFTRTVTRKVDPLFSSFRSKYIKIFGPMDNIFQFCWNFWTPGTKISELFGSPWNILSPL